LAVREVSPDVLIFFAGVTADDLGPGFTAAPGGAQFANRSVLAYHFYKPPQLSAKSQVSEFTQAARRLGTGAMMTETSDGDGLMNIREAADGADGGAQSWAGWEWKSFCREGHSAEVSQLGSWGACKTGYGPVWQGSGGPDVAFISDNARTYATAVAGDIVSMNFDVTYGDFEMVYDVKDGLQGQPNESSVSEIYVWPTRYPNGAVVTATTSSGMSPRVEYGGGDSTSIRVSSSGLVSGDRITVSVKAKDAPAPSPPGYPCEYIIPFNLSKAEDAYTQLPDGDTIILTEAPAAAAGNGTIKVVLRNDADTWWKAITQHRHNKYVREIVSTQGSTREASGAIQIADLNNGDQFVLSKAKFLGAHTNVYCIKHAEDMKPNTVYTFAWKVATGP